jgi:hypothetical protein
MHSAAPLHKRILGRGTTSVLVKGFAAVQLLRAIPGATASQYEASCFSRIPASRQRSNTHKLFMLVTMPSKQVGAEIILSNCLLCAAWIVMFYYLRRHDCYQKHFVIWITISVLLWGLSEQADPVELVFRYLFWGVNAGLVASALVHRYFKLNADPVVQDDIVGVEGKSKQVGTDLAK